MHAFPLPKLLRSTIEPSRIGPRARRSEIIPTIPDSEAARYARCRVAACEGSKERRRLPRKTRRRAARRDSRSAGPVQRNHAQQRDLDSHARRVKPGSASGRSTRTRSTISRRSSRRCPKSASAQSALGSGCRTSRSLLAPSTVACSRSTSRSSFVLIERYRRRQRSLGRSSRRPTSAAGSALIRAPQVLDPKTGRRSVQTGSPEPGRASGMGRLGQGSRQ